MVKEENKKSGGAYVIHSVHEFHMQLLLMIFPAYQLVSELVTIDRVSPYIISSSMK